MFTILFTTLSKKTSKDSWRTNYYWS